MIQWQYFYLNLTGSYPTDSHSREVKYKWVQLARENSHLFGWLYVQVIITGIFFYFTQFQSTSLVSLCSLTNWLPMAVSNDRLSFFCSLITRVCGLKDSLNDKLHIFCKKLKIHIICLSIAMSSIQSSRNASFFVHTPVMGHLKGKYLSIRYSVSNTTCKRKIHNR